MAFVYKPPTTLDFRLHLLDHAVNADTYERVLCELGEGIRETAERADATKPDDDLTLSYEIEFVEGMLGAAFVVCQVQINAVVQAALRVPDPNGVIFPGDTGWFTIRGVHTSGRRASSNQYAG